MKDLKETILDFIDDNKEKTKFIKTFALENQNQSQEFDEDVRVVDTKKHVG